MKRLFCILLLLALSLSACTEAGEDGSSGGSSGGSSSTAAGTASDIAKDASELFTDRDYNDDYAEDGSVHITLNGDSAEADSDAVRISGTIVTVTEAATYVISGTLDDGMLVVDAPDTAKVQLVFDGVQITSRTSAALYVLEADKVFLTLAEGTENALSNGGEFVAVDDNNIDAALFSKQDLTLNGAGSLTVTSPAGHGVVCKDDLVITGGTYTVYAASHGIDANDSVRIADGLLTLDASTPRTTTTRRWATSISPAEPCGLRPRGTASAPVRRCSLRAAVWTSLPAAAAKTALSKARIRGAALWVAVRVWVRPRMRPRRTPPA